ncbi:MAG: group 1 glycosyl transferase [Halomonadaceae bacterium T82-2]|nr:MAG: group 1 glycosyl transferase [Halomonadaceae bacterium T82-2]
MKALLLSAYAAASHRFWADGLEQAFPEIDWQRLELPPRHFQWRVRGNPLMWRLANHAVLEQSFDLVVATSMVDLATLVGLCPSLAQARKVVYFHENQFAFPRSSRQVLRPEPMMVNLYAALAADVVVFNSAYNRDSLVAGARDFLSRMPDRLPLEPWLSRLAAHAHVLPVPLPDQAVRPAGRGRRIVWNHRWEYDKNPEAFFAALERLVAEGIDFEVAVMGQQFRDRPAVFDTARAWLGERIVCWGEQPAADYAAMLDAADIVVSTTDHEFQGLAIMEAVTRGCLPLVPDRLCFPDYYPDACRYLGDVESLVARLRGWLTDPASRPPLPDARQWQWPAWRSAYGEVLGLRPRPDTA